MKVLLAIPKDHNPRRVVPLGTAYIAAVLEKEGHSVRVYDPAPYENIPFTKVLKSFRPELVGFSCTTPIMPKALEMAGTVKEVSGSIPVVFGGVHPTSAPLETLRQRDIDYVVLGEGEETMSELLNSIENGKDPGKIRGIGYKKSGRPVFTRPRPLIEDLDSLPFPARHLFPMRYYTQRSTLIRGCWLKLTNMISSRGCFFNCIYCASKKMFGRRVRFASPERVLDEMESLVNKYRLEGILLSDDTFTVNRKRAIAICRGIKRRGLKVAWRAQSRVNTIDSELVREMAKSGCIQIEFGVESGSDRVLKALKKGTTAEQARRAFRIVKRHRIRTLANFMLGNPEETKEDIEKTRRLAHELDANFTQFYETTPYPGTELHEMAIKRGWMKPGLPLDSYIYGGGVNKYIMQINFKSDELRRIKSKLNNEFMRSKTRDLIRDPRFLLDTLIINLTMPMVPLRAFFSFLKSGSIEDGLRVIDHAQQTRRYP